WGERMKAVGYFLEGARRNGGRRSIGEQRRAVTEVCPRQGYEIPGTLPDAGDQSPPDAGFRQMLGFLRREGRGFMVVAVDDTTALGGDLGNAAMKLLSIEETGVPVLSVQTGKDLAREIVASWAE